MGLLFALQPFPPKSDANTLHLRSHFRKFAMGASLIFAGLFLGVMTFAAAPLFQLMRSEGGFIDQVIWIFFATVLILYPILAAICFLFEEHSILERQNSGLYHFTSYKQLLFIKWDRKSKQNFRLEDLVEENWVGALNAAALEKSKSRYATKGHWLLLLKDAKKDLVIERRARKEEIDWLKFLIEKHFSPAT